MVAASGGPDSCALAIIGSLTGRAVLGHVNHHLQPACHEFERRVIDLGVRLAVPVHVAHVDGNSISDGKNGLEAEARAARYDALAKLWDGPVLTAHTAHDRLDTVLMRLVQGTGLGSLDGPRAQIELSGRTIVRPMLDWFEEDVAELLSAWDLSPTIDPSNSDRQRLRNAVRPIARQLAALAEPEPLARSLENLASDVRRLRRVDERRIDEMTRSVGSDVFVHVGALSRLAEPDAIQTMTVVLGRMGSRASRKLAARILGLKSGERARGTGVVAEHCREVLRLRRSSLEALPPLKLLAPVGAITSTVLGVLRRTGRPANPHALHATLDPALIEGDLVLRSVAEGDRFVPHGKASDVEVFRRMARDGRPQTVRNTRLALADEAGVLWVVGGRRAARALVSDDAESVSFEWSDWTSSSG
ncbi:MAG: tRNA(Ile)-lysidine synthetase-like protein [Bradymonadia bacterium]|jgi:tRNA(Ile)-lysidine synthetase-like protein